MKIHLRSDVYILTLEAGFSRRGRVGGSGRPVSGGWVLEREGGRQAGGIGVSPGATSTAGVWEAPPRLPRRRRGFRPRRGTQHESAGRGWSAASALRAPGRRLRAPRWRPRRPFLPGSRPGHPGAPGSPSTTCSPGSRPRPRVTTCFGPAVVVVNNHNTAEAGSGRHTWVARVTPDAAALRTCHLAPGHLSSAQPAPCTGLGPGGDGGRKTDTRTRRCPRPRLPLPPRTTGGAADPSALSPPSPRLSDPRMVGSDARGT